MFEFRKNSSSSTAIKKIHEALTWSLVQNPSPSSLRDIYAVPALFEVPKGADRPVASPLIVSCRLPYPGQFGLNAVGRDTDVIGFEENIEFRHLVWSFLPGSSDD